jgi:sensor domain CHASE-containing protein
MVPLFLGRTVPTRFPGVFTVIATLEKIFDVQSHFQPRIV